MKIITKTIYFLGSWEVHYTVGDPRWIPGCWIMWSDRFQKVYIHER